MKFSAYIAAGALVCLPVLAQVRVQSSSVFHQEDEDNQQAQRVKWFYEQRRFPLGHIPTGARTDAIAEIKRRAQARVATANASNWTLIGPQPTDAGGNYTTAGRVNAIAIDPRNNKVVYIGAAEGGIWKTTDGGVTWNPLTDDQPSLATGSLLLDPNNPDTIYAGTGEENFSIDSYYGAGILKTTDGGVTWTNLVGPFLRAEIGALALSSDSKTLLCTTELGIWRSSDGAMSWKQVLSASGIGVAAGTSVLFDPTDSSIAYAALGWIYGATQNGIYKSSDGGQTWMLSDGSGATALPDFNVGRITLAIDPTTPSTLYAALQNSSSAKFGEVLGMWKSVDGAGTWNRLSTFPSGFCNEQCWYDMALAIDPQNPAVIYAGGLGVVRSMDGGATWQTLPFAGPNYVYMHTDQHALVFSPDGAVLYIGNDGGVYSTADVTNANVGFSELNDTLALTQFYPGLAVDPSNADTMIGGTQDNGTQIFTGTSSWSQVTCGDGGYAAVDPASPTRSYVSCEEIAIERSDAGYNFYPVTYGIDLTDRVEFIPPLTLDTANPSVLYFGTYRVWQSTDGAGLWTAISPDLTADKEDMIKTIAVAPSDSNVIWAGTEHGRVHLATDLNHPNWTNRSNGLPVRSITRIVGDPVDSMTAYVTCSGFSMGTDTQGHIFRTTNGGQNWTDISGDLPNLPVNDLVVDPDLPGTLYAGTDAGVMITNNLGADWSLMGTGLPLVVVESLVLQRQARVLRAATHGRSVWEIAVPLASPSTQPAITLLTPNQANAGSGSQTVQIAGTNFSSNTVIRWNGEALSTTVQNSTNLSVQVPASDMAVLGQAAVQAFTSSAGGGASNPIYFTVGHAPVSGSQAFVSAANPTGGNTLAPGSIVSLYGANFSGRTVVADVAAPLPFTLGGVTVTLNEVPVPIYFVSPNQINFQVPPFDVAGESILPLVVTQGSLSTQILVVLDEYAPALFTTNSQGTGQASAVISGTTSIASPVGAFSGSRPVHGGEYVSLYCTGLGPVTNTPYLGYPGLSNPLSATIAAPAVTIGSSPATVFFSGLAPGFPGLYQVNVQVPAGLTAGSAVPVALTIGGVSSNTVTIAVE